MRITSLIENTTTNDNFQVEHGLSLYIETNQHKILFDMGQSDLFIENAKKLNINISDIDIAILSHGHYDHGGGLEDFLNLNKKAPIYINRYAFEPHYNGTNKYIGLNTSLLDNNRIIFTGDITTITSELTLYSCNNKTRNHNLGSFGLTTLENNEFVPDDFHHEQYLLIEQKNKKILFSGCSHKGILDITEWFQPDVLIGGFHFSKLPLDNTLRTYANFLNQFNTNFYTCHCTGIEQFEFMKQSMNRLFYLSTGQTIYL